MKCTITVSPEEYWPFYERDPDCGVTIAVDDTGYKKYRRALKIVIDFQKEMHTEYKAELEKRKCKT